jgi:hypothetical protein
MGSTIQKGQWKVSPTSAGIIKCGVVAMNSHQDWKRGDFNNVD